MPRSANRLSRFRKLLAELGAKVGPDAKPRDGSPRPAAESHGDGTTHHLASGLPGRRVSKPFGKGESRERGYHCAGARSVGFVALEHGCLATLGNRVPCSPPGQLLHLSVNRREDRSGTRR
jgi:hypothetical protein